jgi:hypothetical protein
VPKGLVGIKEKSLNLKFKPYNIQYTNQTCEDFIQASEMHSELLFSHCSCYSDTRGVTNYVVDYEALTILSLLWVPQQSVWPEVPRA